MISGKIVSTRNFAYRAYLGRSVTDYPVQFSNGLKMPPQECFAFEIHRAALTSCLIPIELETGELYLDQTYASANVYFRLRPRLNGSDFHLEDTEGEFRLGRHVLIGGSSDMAWYHWILNWTVRLSLIAHLHPELIEDADATFVFHITNSTEQFKAWPRALGIGDKRMLFVDPEITTFYENLIVPTFPDQRFHYPRLLANHRAMLLKSIDPRPAPGHPTRIWISRETMQGEKRKASNFSEIKPILDEFGIVPVVFEEKTLEEQIALFHHAELLVGIHGAGLSNIFFCNPRARVLIIDNDRNISHGTSGMFIELANVAGLRNTLLSMPEEVLEGRDYSQYHILHNRNLTVDPDRLRSCIKSLLSN